MRAAFAVVVAAAGLMATPASALTFAPDVPSAPVEQVYHRGQPHWRHVQPQYYNPGPPYRCVWRRHWDGYSWVSRRVCGYF